MRNGTVVADEPDDGVVFRHREDGAVDGALVLGQREGVEAPGGIFPIEKGPQFHNSTSRLSFFKRLSAAQSGRRFVNAQAARNSGLSGES